MTEIKRDLLKWDPAVPVDEQLHAQKRKTLPGPSTGVDQMNREVINSIFPPVEFTEDGVNYTQSVSITPVTKSDVQKLRLQVTNLLHARKARLTGVCLIRADIYSQLFDEIIRQVTIDCNARGRLLLRVREHSKMTLNAYKELYEITLDWGNRKNMQVNLGMPDLRTYNQELKEKRRTLELKANDLQIKLDTLEKKLAENKALREKDRADEIAFLKRQGQMTKAQIDMIAASATK
jgi:dynein light intermediate chain